MEMRTLYLFASVILFHLWAMACSAMTQKDITTDQAALLSFKAHITLDPHHILQSNWSIPSSVCDWVGVTCGLPHHRVISLNISNMNLTGTLPPQLGNLSFLASLDLSLNNFHGELPEQLANLHRLQVVILNYNSFGGEIPAWLGSLSKLRRFSLSNNSFYGFIPPSISDLTKLEILQLSFNSLQGKIPSGIFNISTLEIIRMGGNMLSGDLPTNICHSLPRLKMLALAYNALGGQIPLSISNCSELRILSLSYNNFSGVIPGEIGKLGKLEGLHLRNNGFFKGTIPQEIGNLHNLQEVDMQETQRIGSIPLALFNISALKRIYLSSNDLEGELREEIGNLYKLEDIYLSGNILSGSIPSSISNCSELRQLSLSYNNFTGVIPAEIGKLEKLEMLHLGENGYSKGVIPREIGNLHNLKDLGMQRTQLTGSIPLALFNISALQFIRLHNNDLEGEIAEEIGKLYKLEGIYLQGNSLSGSIPLGIFNMSNLRELELGKNQFVGTLPSNMFYGLPNLEKLFLYENNLGGVIPNSISNSTRLQLIQLHYNEFIGEIPDSLGDLKLLYFLTLGGNNLTSQGLKFITSLTKCQYLRMLDVSGNFLDGNFPISIGNLSALENFYAYGCKIRGSIPSEIGNLRKLILLSLSDNYLSGPIPTTLKSIQFLDIANNSIDGSTLHTLCELQNLFYLNLDHNNLFGPIPSCLNNVFPLQHLSIHDSGLTSIPPSFWNLENLIWLDLSSNFINGSLPQEIGNLKAAMQINLSKNQFTGDIPNVFANLANLESLLLSHNKLGGSIPDSLGKTVNLKDLDLFHNNLSGSIPKSLEALKYLKDFNVSFNNLGGQIPSNGPFKNFTAQSFVFNDALCGDSRFQVPPCPISSTNKRRRLKKTLESVLIPLGIALTILAMVIISLLTRYRRREKDSSGLESFYATKERVSYYELLKATNKYAESNLLGSGSFGSVYRGILKDGSFVAVKVFNLQSESSFKSFETECQVLRNLRHRNLAKVITSCCTDDFKALVLEYMSNGSLEKWLYSHNYFLNAMQRLNIMIDVACALDYLHHGYSMPLVHCDLKPSNVLIDEDMVAYVSDFGIAKLLGEGQSISHTNTLGTLGYIAPEYGLEGLVSTRCDVYSFGIMMMEVFTRKKPSDEMFAGNLSLKSWISNSTPHAIIQVVDANLIIPEEQYLNEKLKCLSSIMKLALSCSTESPNERINMSDVVATLKEIKLEFLAYCGGS